MLQSCNKKAEETRPQHQVSASDGYWFAAVIIESPLVFVNAVLANYKKIAKTHRKGDAGTKGTMVGANGSK
jgi:hypothetical protein